MESQNSDPSQLYDVSLEVVQLTAEDVTAEEVVQSPRIDGTPLPEGSQLVDEKKTNNEIKDSIVVDKSQKESASKNVVESEGPQMVAEVTDSFQHKANDGVTDSVVVVENQDKSPSENVVESDGTKRVAEVTDRFVEGEKGKDSLSEGIEDKANDGVKDSIAVAENRDRVLSGNVVVESEGTQLVAVVTDSLVVGENGKDSTSKGVQVVGADKANDGATDSVVVDDRLVPENVAVESEIKLGDQYPVEVRVQIDSQQNRCAPAGVANDVNIDHVADVNITQLNGKYDTDTRDSITNGTQSEGPTTNGTSPALSSTSPSHGEKTTLSPLPGGSPRNQPSLSVPPSPSHTSPDQAEKENRLQEQLKNYESQIEQLKAALVQKENTIVLYQRENALLEKEKSAFRKEKELATKEKENIVIKFATKEKSLIDAKKQKDTVEKQLADSRKEVKNISTKFHALNEEKSRITYMLDEKCNEVKKYQKELEKQRAEYGNLEMKLKWNSVKLVQETEAKLATEKKLEEERNAPKPHEEKANEKLKMEYEATAILLKHEIENKDKTIESLTKEHKQATEKIAQLQESLSKEILENTNLSRELECLRQEHGVVQNSYSEEMLNSAKLRGQLEELQVLRTQHTINEDKINTLNESLRELEEKLQDSSQDLEQLHAKEKELLSINKEMSEMIVGLQNEICLLKSKVQGVEAENSILKKEKLEFDTKYNSIESQLNQEVQQKNEERLLLTKHLSEKTKLYESVKVKLDNAQGDLEATKKKHSQIVKELQREIQKYKKLVDENTSASSPTLHGFCRNCQLKSTSQERVASRGSNNSRSDSESEAQSTTSTMNYDGQGPSKQHLVERILRLQQASARQTEKIDFLENHTLSLVAELQKKSKVVQYYMMRDQAGALTSSKSDQNKTELAKYGGVMSAIYSGIKGPNQSMTLELSLEINKKLQAVLEDTLLKNITLKENLDVLGLEVDKLTRKLAQTKS